MEVDQVQLALQFMDEENELWEWDIMWLSSGHTMKRDPQVNSQGHRMSEGMERLTRSSIISRTIVDYTF